MARKDQKLNGTVIVTYRCNARCSMCSRFKAPSKPDEEIILTDAVDGNIGYYRDEEDRHYVPKRSVQDMIIRGE